LADNLPPSCAVVTKSGNLNFLEPSGPVQACNGTALPFNHDKWAPAIRSWGVLRLRMEERQSIWRVAANIFNKQSLTAEKRWSSTLGVGSGDKKSSP